MQRRDLDFVSVRRLALELIDDFGLLQLLDGKVAEVLFQDLDATPNVSTLRRPAGRT